MAALPGVIGVKVVARPVFFPSALDAALNTLNLVDDDIVHTA